MKFFHIFRTVSFLSILATFSAFSQNYEISIAINNSNDTVILGNYFTKKEPKYSVETIVLKNGKGVFRGDKKLPRGIYFIYSDAGSVFFEIIIGDNQQFGIMADTTDLFNRIRFTNSSENDVFYEFQRDNINRNRQTQQLNEELKNASSDDEKNEIRDQMQRILIKERLKYIEKLIDENSNLYVSKFIRATVPPEIYMPEPPRDDEGNITDHEFQRRWYRTHFFDNLNIFDPDMLRTYFYEDKLLDYVTKVIPQITDTVCVEIDKIMEKALVNDEIFRCVLVNLYNNYSKSIDKVIMENGVFPENVWIHLLEKWYIPHARFSTEEFIENRKEDVKNRKPNLIGKHAPPMEQLMVLPSEHFRAAALDTAIKFDVQAGRMVEDFRKELKSKYTLLFFWDYTCGHCKSAFPKLLTLWEEWKDKGLDVIAVQVVASKEAKGKSIDYLNEQNMLGWTNAWCPFTYKYKELYNLSNTPKLFLLDEKGDIILNRIGVENLVEFFNAQQPISQE